MIINSGEKALINFQKPHLFVLFLTALGSEDAMSGHDQQVLTAHELQELVEKLVQIHREYDAVPEGEAATKELAEAQFIVS